MNNKLMRTLTLFTVFALTLSLAGLIAPAEAAGSIYVNGSSNVLDMDITDAYAVGSGGAVAKVGDTYALTGNGTVKLGSSSGNQPGVPSGDPDGSTVKVSANVAKIGLYYYYSSSRDTSLTEANLQNQVGAGYQFGYYDSNRVFQSLSSTTQTKITMKPTGSGREVSVYITGTDTKIYTHTNTSYNLAVRPVSNGSKAVTLFKNNTYYGDFEYYRYVSNKLTVINVLNVEDYVKGVITIEMSSSWPREALKAQALCARTYFARNLNSYSKYGFDITADTYCQAYVGRSRSTSNSDAAVDETAGQYVTYNGALCDTLYYSANGGGSENSENVFVSALPYLRGVLDPYEKDAENRPNGVKSWTRNISKSTLEARIRNSGRSFGTFSSMDVVYSPTENAIKLTFTDTSGKTAVFSGNACFNFLYGDGNERLPSIHFTYKDNGTSISFTGSGLGHSVGMSQFGAYAMANSHGFNYRQIIRFYYTGVKISTAV